MSIRNIMMLVPICALACTMAFAQSTAQISGQVSDVTGAVLPGVDVIVTQTDTGLMRNVVSNETGSYSFPNLNPGLYQLEVSLPGFQTYLQTGIELQVGANLVIDTALAVGQVAQTIEVIANSEVQVETRRMGISQVLENERILELPLNGRQVTDLITLSGAAVQTRSSPSYSMATGVNISVAGGQRFGVSYTLDGAMHKNRFDDTNFPLPFPNALQEFRLSTSAQEAGTGRATGASVSSVTKSGTNQFHGDAFWFVRNAVFNAQEADAASKDQLKRNQFGGTIGGPIIQNKLFFFAGYQGTVLRQAPSSTLSIVPTPAILSGDWTAFNQCYDPDWDDSDFEDGTVDPARYSPAALLFSARLPAAQNACGEIRWGTGTVRDDKQPIARVDYQVNDNHSIFGRYMATLQDRQLPYDASNLLTAAGSGFADKAQSVTFGHTWVISPQAIYSIRFGYNRMRVNKFGAKYFSPKDVGINSYTSVPDHFGMSVDDHFSIGAGSRAKRLFGTDQYQIGGDLTLTRGSHQIGFGGTFGRDSVYSRAHTRGVGGPAVGTNLTGNAMGDFMLGQLRQIRQSMPSILSQHQDYIGVYLQDTWRATSNLTLNLGVRWEPFLPQVWVELENSALGGVRVYNFSKERFKAGQKSAVFPTAPAGFHYPSQGSGPGDLDNNSAVPSQYSKLAPRVGLAWDPTGEGRTSVRISYGIAYDVVRLGQLLNSNNVSPWAADIIHRNGTLDDPWKGLAGGSPFPFDWRTNPKFLEGSVFLPFNPNLSNTYTQSWSLAFQQQIADDWRFSATYLGNQTVDLWGPEPLNPASILTQQSHPGLFTGPNTCVLEGKSYTPCNSTRNVNQRRELRMWAAASNKPALLADAKLFSFIDEFNSHGTANYHGFLTTIRGELSGINLNANYTWSHCISDKVLDSNPGRTPMIGRDRGNCGSDRRHIFNMTAVAATPEFANPTAQTILSDWRLSAIYRVSSGAYHHITTGSNRSLTEHRGSDQRANQILDDVYLDKSGGLGTRLYNKAAFAHPALGTFGNMGRYAVSGFPNWDLDVALSRTFSVSENQALEVRAEAFNITNSVRPNDPSGNFRSGNFGKIRSVQDPRIMQFALKYTF